MHDPVPQTGRWLKAVVQGYFRYYAVPVILGSRLCEPGQPQPKQRHYVHRAYLEGFVDRPLRWETKPFRLWERILADNAKAEFIVAGIGKPREGGASYYLM